MAFRPRILVVENDPGQLKTLTETLSQMGADVVQVTESRTGGERIAREKFDGFFIGCRLAGISGLQLARMVRASNSNKSTPMIMLAGKEDAGALQESFQSGANFFLQKPVTAAQVRRLMNASRGMMLEERRRYQRASGDFPVICQWGPKSVRGKAVNVSATGMLLALPEIPPKEADLELEFALPGGAKPLKLQAIIIRLTSERHLALQFTDLDHAARKQLMDYTDRVLETSAVA